MSGEFTTPENMEPFRSDLRGSIVMHDLIAKVTRQIASEIEDWCRRARDKGMNVAISQLYSDLDLTGVSRHIFNIKYDAMMLKPGQIPPTGWTLYEVAK